MTDKICCWKHCNAKANYKTIKTKEGIKYCCAIHAQIWNIQWNNFGKTEPYATPLGEKNG